MTELLYFLIIVVASLLGAISGMGGGIIIKPAFDFLNLHSVAEISFYSTVAVLTMSVVSLLSRKKDYRQVQLPLLLLVSLGSFVGGIMGNLLLGALFSIFSNDSTVQLIQISLTIALLLFGLIYSWFNQWKFQFNHFIWYILCGLILGLLASLLSIGGGPINVSLLILLFSVSIKEATYYSICIIFTSQLASIIANFITTRFVIYDLSMLPIIIIPAALLGGLLGAKFSNILSNEKVTIVFQTVIILVLFINIYNIISIVR